MPVASSSADELSDAAVAHLVEGLYLFATALESGYYSQLRRYYAKHQTTTNSTPTRHPQQPSTCISPMMTCRSDRHPAPIHDAVRTDPGSRFPQHLCLGTRSDVGILADRELPSTARESAPPGPTIRRGRLLGEA